MADSSTLNEITEALASGDLDTCRPLIQSSLENEPSLRLYIQCLVAYGGLHPLEQESSHQAQMHPVVYLNSLKNLVSLRLEDPSEPLITLATRVALSLTPDPPKKSWRDVAPDKLNEPMFVMDLLRALEEGNREKAFEEAARMSHLSDNEIYLVDILTEAAVREFPRLGILGYAFHRAAAFCERKDTMTFAYRLLEAVSREPIGPLFPAIPDGFRVDFFAGPILKSGNVTEVILLAAAERLWNLDSMKRAAYRKAVVGWLGERWADVGEEENQGPPLAGKAGDWSTFLKRGDAEGVAAGMVHARSEEAFNWPVEVAEYWIAQGATENLRHFVLLDALQHLVKVLPIKHVKSLAEQLVSISHKG